MATIVSDAGRRLGRAGAGRWVWARVVVEGLALLALFVALLAYVQYGTPSLTDNDGYYHMRTAQLIREQGLTPRFTWLPLTILGPDDFYDHHLLYHVYLAAFVGDGSPEVMVAGAKLASVLMPSLAFLAIWWLLRGQRVRWAGLWSLGLLAVSEAFLYRMSMPRAQAASLLVLALGLHWLLTRRYALLLPLGFVYVWLYNAFPLLLVVAGVYVGAALLTERRLAWEALLYPAAGVALGLFLNPYFPTNVDFIVQHILPKVTEPTATSVGNEWYPYQTWTLVENSGPALALWLLGVFAVGWRGRRWDRATLTAFALSVVYGFMLFKSRRFVEYFPPFALIFGALSVAPLLDGLIPRLARGGSQESAGQPPQLRGLPRFLGVPAERIEPAAALLALVVVALLVVTLPQARASMATARPSETYAAASSWLREHALPGSMIFQTDWDDFPRLFFYNTASVYTVGLDPTYLELADGQLYEEWVAITRGEVDRPGAAIRERFGASYVVSDLQHERFLRQAADDPLLREVFRDEFAVVFEVTGGG